MKRFFSYCKNVLIAIDQLTNTICGGFPDETISAVCWRKSLERGHYGHKFLKFVLDITFSPVKQDHCFQSYLSEVKRSQLPASYKHKNVD
jgi:hypothetical protein